MADAAPHWTPFRYGFNNPIIVTGPTGMFEKDWEGNIFAEDEWRAGDLFSDENNDLKISGVTGDGKKKKERDVREDGYGDRFSLIDEVDVLAAKSKQDGPAMTQEQIDNAYEEARKYGGDGSGGFTDKAMRVMDAINDYNPIANLWDVITYAYSGQDRLGNKMSQAEANLKAVSVMPVGKVFKAGTVVITAVSKTAKLEYSFISNSIRSSLNARVGKTGFTEVGYQFQKHAGRLNSSVWKTVIPKGATLNPATFNKAGWDTLKEIVRAPGKFNKVGNFFEKRLPDGRGIRFQSDRVFKGFLD